MTVIRAVDASETATAARAHARRRTASVRRMEENAM
jgi:hypothetical protein